ncbi:MAG: M48 family metalloprotease [Terrabacter sp.]
MSELHPPAAPPQPTRARPRGSWFARRKAAALDAASTRIHSSLLDVVSRGGRPSTSTRTSRGVLAFSVLILVAYAVAVVLLVVAVFASKNLYGWIGVVLGWLAVIAVAPRPNRLADVRPLGADEFPNLHLHVAAIASAVGTREPDSIFVSTEFEAGVTRLGWGRRQVLVIGLPLWTLLTDDARLALLAHEMGHLRGGDTTTGYVTWMAHGVLHRFATLLTPLPSDAYSDFTDYRVGVVGSQAILNAVGSFLLRILSMPATLLLLLFERLDAVSSQRDEYLADLRAAEVAGSRAVVDLLVTLGNVPGLHTLASAAVRRRDDPFAVLDGVRERPAPTSAQVAAARHRALQEDLRWDASHPRDDLRLSLVEARAAERTLPRTEVEGQADAELVTLRGELSRRFSDDLTDSFR